MPSLSTTRQHQLAATRTLRPAAIGGRAVTSITTSHSHCDAALAQAHMVKQPWHFTSMK